MRTRRYADGGEIKAKIDKLQKLIDNPATSDADRNNFKEIIKKFQDKLVSETKQTPKPVAKKPTTTAKPVAKKPTTTAKPVAKKPTTTAKPVAKKPVVKKPVAKPVAKKLPK